MGQGNEICSFLGQQGFQDYTSNTLLFYIELVLALRRLTYLIIAFLFINRIFLLVKEMVDSLLQ